MGLTCPLRLCQSSTELSRELDWSSLQQYTGGDSGAGKGCFPEQRSRAVHQNGGAGLGLWNSGAARPQPRTNASGALRKAAALKVVSVILLLGLSLFALQHGESFVWVKFRPLDMSPDSLVVLDEYGSLLLLTWVGSRAQQEFIGILESGAARGTKMLPRYGQCTALEMILIIGKLNILTVMKLFLFRRCEAFMDLIYLQFVL